MKRIPMPAALLALLLATAAQAAAPPPVIGDRGLVAADHPIASQVGAEVLADGGNVIDAAVATAFALGVLNPHSSGIGGGGFLVFYRAGAERADVIDFRETGPAAARPDMYIEDGKPMPKWATTGPLAVGVPGEVKGLWLAHQRFGKLPWKRLVAPAEKLAREGFPVGWHLAAVSRYLMAKKGFEPHAGLRKEVLRGGKTPYRPGELLVRKELGKTLARIRDQGPAGFYEGPVANSIVAAMGRTGLITLEDLQAYTPRTLTPVIGEYRGMQVFSMPPPSSGGLVLVQALGLLGRHDLRALGHNSSAYLHLLGQTLLFGFAERANLMGDLGKDALPYARITGKAHLDKLAAAYDPEKVVPHPDWKRPKPVPQDGGTSNLSIMDTQGNAVALTTTVNTLFGSKLVAPGTGIVLNNQMDDFSIQPGVPNTYGLIGSEANAPRAGRRPLSSMSPSIFVKDGKAIIAAGASGGPRIITATLQSVLNVVDFGMDPQDAVSRPRIHHQWVPDLLAYEDGIAGDVVEGLRRRGHPLAQQSFFGVCQMVVRRDLLPAAKGGLPRPWKLEAASDPRKAGVPAGR